mgnify:CR=1 FL=1
MSTVTVVSNQYYDLLFHEDIKLVHHIYKPAMSSAQVKELLTAGTDLMEKYGATKWLSDNRQLVNTFSDDVAQWVNNVWLPRTIKAGWKYWAMVVPESVIGRADHVKYVESFYNTGIWVTVYTDVESAMKWIESV